MIKPVIEFITPDEINNDLMMLLDECIANGSRGYMSLGAWFDATCQRIADTLEDIRSKAETIPPGTDAVKILHRRYIDDQREAGLELERIQVHVGAMAREEVCPNGKDPSTVYEINVVKTLADYGTKLLRKWVDKHGRD